VKWRRILHQADIFGMLAAPGPFDEYADKMMLFGQFVGSWDIDGIWYQQDGTRRIGKGEWHFDRSLKTHPDAICIRCACSSVRYNTAMLRRRN
jgi:hypothetical protein